MKRFRRRKKKGGRPRREGRRRGPDDPLRFDLFRECLRFGGALDRARAGDLEELYRRFASGRDARSRLELLLDVGAAVEEGIGSVAALLPFLLFDGRPSVVRTAAMEIALLTPLHEEDSMTGPRHLLQAARETPDDVRRAGILGGLLLLGDRRVLEWMDDAWRTLEPAFRPLLLDAWSGYAFAPTIEFHLRWAEEALPDNFSRILEAVASIRERALHPAVLDIERKFPVNGPGEDRPFRVKGEWTFKEYGRILAPRFDVLARRGLAPEAVRKMRSAWGVKQ